MLGWQVGDALDLEEEHAGNVAVARVLVAAPLLSLASELGQPQSPPPLLALLGVLGVVAVVVFVVFVVVLLIGGIAVAA